MLPYISAVFLSALIFNVAYKFKFNQFARFFTYLLASLPLIAITAFKNITIGTDTVTYVYFFQKTNSLMQMLHFSQETGEIGFWAMNLLGHFFSNDYFILYLIITLIVTSCYLYSIKTFKLGTLSFITLLLIGPYFFQMNGTRQAVAIAIFSVSVIFIIKKQLFFYIISILIGVLFHKSMIVCLPLYFIFIGEIKARKVAAILVIFILFLVFFQSFINIASDIDFRYSNYGTKRDSAGGVVVSSFNIILLAWFVLCRKINAHILGTKTYDTLLVLYLLGSLISILSIVLGIDPSGFLRLSLYFIQMNMFLLPMTILSFRDDITRYIITFFAILLMTLYFYMTTSAFSHLTPYRFNPIIEALNEN